MPVLPFHRYIGPGNDIDNGPCVDQDDCIAKKHDIKYENAKTPQDVRLADVEAIEEFRTSWMNGNWHSLIGDVGLSLKYCVETYTGVIYPKLGRYEPCEIITLFHDIIKLHCVNKERLVNRYSQAIRVDRADPDFTRLGTTRESFENFFYVLVMWYRLYHKSQDNSHRKNLTQELSSTELHDMFHNVMLPKVQKRFPLRSSSSAQNCDIFNLNVWIRFFSMIQPHQQHHHVSDYSDEDLSNMFLQYD